MGEPEKSRDGVFAILGRVYALLNASERRYASGLLVLVLLNSVVDLLGLAAVIPVIGMVVEPELLASNAVMASLYDLAYGWGVVSEKRFLALLCGLLVAAFAFKTVFGIWMNHVQSRFGFRVAHRLSGALWMHHFSDSLERMRSKESGRVLTEINSWPVLFARVFVTGGQLFFNEVVVMILLAVGLTAYDPMVFLGVGGIVGVGALIIRLVTRQRLRQNSAAIQRLAPASSSIVQNAVRGFLELITFRAVGSVQRTYLNRTRELYRVHSRQMVLGIVPTRLYEFLAVTALCGIIVASLWMGDSDAAFFETLSLLALSAYRVMPAMSRINARLIAMRGQMHLLAAMEGAGKAAKGKGKGVAAESAEASTEASHPPLAGPVSLHVRDLTLGYEGGAPVIEGLNATFEPGRIHTITGASGSGKSTLISALLGLHPPSSGQVLIEGRELGGELAPADWLGSVAYLSQHPFLFAGTVRENLTLGAEEDSMDEAGALALIQRLGLHEALGTSPLDFQLYEGGSNLSGGQQQRLALIRALRLERPVLVLDEATSGLDGAARDAVLAVLEAYVAAGAGRTVLLVTHDADVRAKHSGIGLDDLKANQHGAS